MEFVPTDLRQARRPDFDDLVRTFGRIGLQSFGGPAGQIAVMHRILVDEKRWLDEPRFLHALQFCMLLPGPEAMQLAAYTGWLLGGLRGALVAGGLFIAPGFAALLALSLAYSALSSAGLVAAIFLGVKAAVVAIVFEALGRISKRALASRASKGVAVAAFVLLFAFSVPFPLVVALAALLGAVTRGFGAPPGDVSPDDGSSSAVRWRSTATTLAVGVMVWLAPLAAIAIATGTQSIWTQIGAFFAGAAVVTFGGAYAVLAYVAQQAVEVFGWLDAGTMLDGLALAESTPGPLIMVTQFVGYHAAFGDPGTLNPALAGLLGSVLTTWVTFVPSFVFVLAGAPWMERLRGRRGLSSALGAVMAAVVGVIANLSVYVTMQAIFRTVLRVDSGPWHLSYPEWASVDWRVLALVVFAGGLLRWRHNMPLTLGVCAVLGFAMATIWP